MDFLNRQFLSEIENISCLAGEFIAAEFGTVGSDDIEVKSLNSLVSYVDKKAEEIIVDKLSTLLPDAAFITEEDTVDQGEDKQYTWIIDPLDGTTNFLTGIPHFSVSIALANKKGIIAGVVYDVMRKELFSASKGGGFMINGVASKSLQSKPLSEAIIVTGFPYAKNHDFKKTLEVVAYFLENARGFRRLGSAALDLAYVATGRLDLYYESNLNIWDIAAGVLLVEEAGGQVIDYQGGSSFLERGEIIAGHAGLVSQAAPEIQKHFLT